MACERTAAWVPTSALAEALGLKQDKKKETIDLERTGGEWNWSLCWVVSGTVCGGGGSAAMMVTEVTPLKVEVNDKESKFHGKIVDIPAKLLMAQPAVLANAVELDAEMPPNDLITLTHLHEASVMDCLKKRYESDIIYTSTGPILIALNPFKNLHELYDDDVMGHYWAAGEQIKDARSDLAPHVFGAAHAAFRKMMEGIELKISTGGKLKKNSCDQSMLVSGESGAGKTVTTKHIMRYLATLSQRKAEHAKRCRAASPGRSEGNAPGRSGGNASRRRSTALSRRMSRNDSWKLGTAIEEKVLESNPILESFGNARTVRNDNSSRFGKFIELQFKQTGSLIGASIETYLLEKVRLIHQNPGERNFHVFYELLAAASEEEREDYFLGDLQAKDFKMTNSSGTFDRRDGADDTELFFDLNLAMGTMGFEPQTQDDIFAVTVAFLHASNVTFTAVTDDSSKVDQSNPSLEPMLKLLGLQVEEFQSAMCEFEIETGIDSYRRQVNQELAAKGLEAFIKGTYGAMFAFIVQTINKKIGFKPTGNTVALNAKAASISVLDIFGFESVAVNSFEQLCINYCNEALQQQFNLFIFKSEQEEYKREGIAWDMIEFPDNQDVIDLIERKSEGIIPLLTDQCRTARGNDKSFAEAICKFSASSSRFAANPLQKASGQFIVHHYAGPVLYNSAGFVEKNKDEIPRAASILLQSSKHRFVQLLGKIIAPPTGERSNKRPTVGSQFASQLNELRKRIDETYPHYVRCLKPNQSLKANEFNKAMVADQLRYCGVLEAIRVSRSGYSQRYSFGAFVERYRFIALDELKTTSDNVAKSVDILVQKVAAMMWQAENPNAAPPGNLLLAAGIQKGKTKVFLRQNAFEYIEHFRSEKLNKAAAKIQSGARRRLERHRFLENRRRIVLTQACARRYRARKILTVVRKRKAATKIQKQHRGIAVRSQYVAKKKVARWGQAHCRGGKARAISKELREKREQELAKEHLQYKSAVSIQKLYRSKAAKNQLKELKAQKLAIEANQASFSEEQARVKELEGERLKAELKADRATAIAIEAEHERAKEKDLLERQLGEAAREAETAKGAQEELKRLKAELEKLKAELADKTEAADHSASRVHELEEENKKLKMQLKEGVTVALDDYSNEKYEEHSDLKQLDARLHGIAMRSKQGKKDLEALVQSLFILK